MRAAISQSSLLKSSVEKTQADHAKGPSTKVVPKARCRVLIITTASRLAQTRARGSSRTIGIVASKIIVAFVMKMIAWFGR